ncbi:hypothetical protein WJX74_009010 [Apatococcus lobatus]|uniref:Glutamine amidotransferase domain-containing protein n=1 Tax=Apatococcus lobatus TaxID=904363 RepID=A0AAW1RFP5_9CHLO
MVGICSRVKRLALLDCEDAPKWAGHEQLWYQRFYVGQATWTHFRCWAGELPTLQQSNDFDAFFVGGSHYSAYEALAWIDQLRDWLRAILTSDQYTAKVVAVCFGCQMAAQALGGVVGRNPNDRFVLKVEDLEASKDWRQQPYFQDALAQAELAAKEVHSEQRNGSSPVLRVIESHGDQVLELPVGAQLLGSSSTSPLDAWAYSNRLLALQGHPEMTCSMVAKKILQPLTINGRLSASESAAAEESLGTLHTDHDLIIQIMASFIAGPAQHSPPETGPETRHQAC